MIGALQLWAEFLQQRHARHVSDIARIDEVTRPSPAAPAQEPAAILPPARSRMSANAGGRRTVDATGSFSASICTCHAKGLRRVAGPKADSLTIWRTPTATALSMSAISLATCRSDEPCETKSRSAPRSAS